MTGEREHYIDLVRGICAVSIVFIHTCFFSGDGYVPRPMRSISLLLDVPAFFFIAGMTRAYIQKDTIPTQLFKLSMVFVLLGLICNLIDGEVTWASIFRPMFLMGIKVSSLFKGVLHSYWFVPVYACTIILGGVIVKSVGRHIPWIIVIIVLTYTLAFGGELSFAGYRFLGVGLDRLLFPVAIYLFGYWCQKHIIPAKSFRRRGFALLLAVGACIVYYLCFLHTGDGVYNLQSNKFPAFKLPYIAASCLSMAGIIFFASNALRNRFFEHIGRNAIFYYAGQGVSSSCLFFITPHICLAWGIKLPIMFAINLTLAIIFSEALRLVDTALISAIRVDKEAILRRLLLRSRSAIKTEEQDWKG